jgi:hypothetical protein
MKLSYLPVLGILRELYAQPRNMARFRDYITRLTGDGDDVVLPIGVANPMAKEQALSKIDELLALGAEEIGAAATADAAARLQSVETVPITASIVLADDVGGGWTNRYTTEAMVRFPSRGALKRPFATALAWTSESPTASDLRHEVLAAIYRVAYQQRFGLPATLRERLRQEGLAASFAEVRAALPPTDLQAAQKTIDALGDDPPYPQVFAALYGDAAAAELGYQPLGLPPRAGFEVAKANDWGDPVTKLNEHIDTPGKPRKLG